MKHKQMIQNETSEEPSKNMASQLLKFKNSIFEIPNFNSAIYKKNICEMFKQIEELNQFTTNLQQKVDNLLAAQQNQFVNAYTSHMKKIKHEFKAFQQEMLNQSQLIKYYENQGKMSNLIKKVSMLEDQSKNLYAVITKKDKQIKSLQLGNKVESQENKRLMLQIKQFMRSKNQQQLNKKQQQFGKTKQNIGLKSAKSEENQVFATQVVELEHSLKQNLSRTTDEKGKLGFISNSSENSLLGMYQPKLADQNQMKKKISQLQTKNKRLAALNSKVLQSRNEFQNLFFDAVSEVKKQIKLRKKINFCSYEDFRKEDKLNLLIMVISNQQILRLVYEGLFQQSFEKKNNISIGSSHQPSRKTNLRLKQTNSQFLSNHHKNQQIVQLNLSEQSHGAQQHFNPQYRNTKIKGKIVNRRGRTQDLSALPYL